LDIDKVQIPAEMEWKPMKGPAMKRTVISKAPQILAVHLVRSVYDRGLGAGRNGCEVSFTEDLEIPVGGEEMERKWKEEAVEDDEEGEKFRLMSVVTHKGWHESGHYMCYRRRKREKKVKKERKDGDVKENVESTVQEIAEGETAPQDEGLMVKLVDSRTKWWEISDEVVLGVDSEHVLRQRKGVYILFYENEKGL
jgi:ubiquitin carboxyl-terminal hydrolase 16